MFLKAIMYQHKYLKRVEIIFDRKKIKIPQDKFLFLKADNNKILNHYTFLIGENGTGKTTTLKIITHYLNCVAEFALQKNIPKDERMPSNDDILRKSDKINRFNKSYIEFIKMITGLDDETFKLGDILHKERAQLIFISNSTFEDKILSINDRFKSFVTEGKIVNNKYMLLKALASKEKKLDELLKYLQVSKKEWTLRIEIPHSKVKRKGRRSFEVFLQPYKEFNIAHLTNLVATILNQYHDKNQGFNIFVNANKRFFETLKDNAVFKDILLTTGVSTEDVINKIINSELLRELNILLSRDLKEGSVSQLKVYDNAPYYLTINNFVSISSDDIYNLQLLESLGLIEVSLLAGEKNIEWLSSGEKSMIRLFCILANRPKIDEKTNLIVLYDEPENGLHPKWQRSFFDNLKQIVEDIYNIKASHFIIATHSPLIIMDIANVKNADAIKLWWDREDNFNSERISNIESFSIESIFMDEFDLSYRTKEKENDIKKFLKNKLKSDPIDSIKKSFVLKDKIIELRNKYVENKQNEIHR